VRFPRRRRLDAHVSYRREYFNRIDFRHRVFISEQTAQGPNASEKVQPKEVPSPYRHQIPFRQHGPGAVYDVRKLTRRQIDDRLA